MARQTTMRLLTVVWFVLSLTWSALGQNVTITYMHPFPNETNLLIEETIRRFEAENPGVTVENIQVSWNEFWDKLAVMMAGGVGPDVLHMVGGYSNSFMAQGLFADLTPFMERDAVEASDYWANFDLLSYDGKQYGLPYDTSIGLVFYNRPLLDQAGLAYPWDGWTWEDFRDYAKKLTRRDLDGEVVQYGGLGLPIDWGLEDFLRQAGGGMFGADGSVLIDSPESVEAVQWLADLWLVDGAVVPWSLGYMAGSGFMGGQAAMSINGTFGIQVTASSPGLDFGIALLPMGQYDTQVTMGGGIGVNARSPELEMAWKFVKYFGGSENLTYLMGEGGYGIPAHRDGIWSYLEYLMSLNLDPEVVNRGLMKAETLHLPLEWPTKQARLQQALERIYHGDEPARNALENVAREWRAASQ